MVVTVPGDSYFSTVNRDPYQDLVYLAKDLGLAGVDIGTLNTKFIVKRLNAKMGVRFKS